MDEWIVSGLVLLLVSASLASHGWDLAAMRNRENWWWASVILLEILLIQNWYMKAVLGVLLFGLFQIGRSWFVIRMFVIPAAGIAGVYALVTPHVQPWMIVPVLWAGAGIGAVLGIWAAISWRIGKPYQYTLPFAWPGFWWIGEEATGSQAVICGQGNTMHLASVTMLCTVCAGSLVRMGHWLAVPLVLLCVLPLVAIKWLRPKAFSQIELCLICLALGIAFLIHPVTALSAAAVTALWLTWYVKPWKARKQPWHDSTRLAYWKDAITLVWWPNGWKTRLFGFGSCTWFPSTVRMCHDRNHQELLTAAHNEFLQFMHEHGILGLLILLAYLGDAFWRTAHGGPEGQAVFLLGCVMMGSAFVNFPWTFFHEFHAANQKEQHWYGSPTLNVWAIVIAILAEGF